MTASRRLIWWLMCRPPWKGRWLRRGSFRCLRGSRSRCLL
nr:MAG TPA: hypothetical protein [Caudoviricetes sp.]